MMKLPLLLIVVAFADLVFSVTSVKKFPYHLLPSKIANFQLTPMLKRLLDKVLPDTNEYSVGKAEYFKIRIVGSGKCLGNLGGRPVIQFCRKTPGQWWKWGGESGKQILTKADPTIGLYYDPRDDKMEIRQVNSSNHFDWEFSDGKWYGSDYNDRPIEVWTSGKPNSQPYGANTGDSKSREDDKELKKWQISLKTFYGGHYRFKIRHDLSKMCLKGDVFFPLPYMDYCLDGKVDQIWYWDGNRIKSEMNNKVLAIQSLNSDLKKVVSLGLMNASENRIQAQFKHENGFIKSLWSPNGDDIRVVPYQIINLGWLGWTIRIGSRWRSLVGAMKFDNQEYTDVMKWSLIPLPGEEAVWPVAMPLMTFHGLIIADSVKLYVKYGPSHMTIMWPKY